jgi:hypothetical protein
MPREKHPERQFPKRSRPTKGSRNATRNDPDNQENPQNPDETSVSVACLSGC